MSGVFALSIGLIASFGCGGRVAPTGDEGTRQAHQASFQAGVAVVPCVAWANAVVANTGNVMLNAGALIDSYQPAVGPYGVANTGSAANVEVATTLTNNGGIIHGGVTQNLPAGLSVIPVPTGATNLPLGSSSPGSLNINTASDDITLGPGDYVAANISVNSPGAIKVSPQGTVRIWVTGSLNLGGNENPNGNPRNLTFLVTSSGVVNVNSNGALYGLIYAPTSGIILDSTVYGAVIGATLTLNSGAAVHFPQGRFANALPSISTSVAYAESRITLGSGDQTVGGDVGVAVAVAPLGTQLVVGNQDCLDLSQTVYGPTVSLGSGAKVGDIDTNALTNGGAQFVSLAPYPASAMPLLPLTFGGAAGTNNVTAAAGQSVTLSPGSFGALVDNGLVSLKPGTYSFASVTLGNNAQLQALQGGATTIFVAGALATGTGAQIFPVGQQASALTILAAGSDGTSGSPPAASLGASDRVIALLSVPHGTLSIGDNSQCIGAFAGFTLVAGTNVTLQFQGGFPASTPSGLALVPGHAVPPAEASAPLIGPVPGNAKISLGLELPIQNQPGFLTLLQGLYDPTSPTYQQFKSPSYLASNFASASLYQSLVGWAQSQGLQVTQNANNTFLLVSGPAAAIESAFLVNLNLYGRSGGGQFYAADRNPFNPSAAPRMDNASGFNNFNLPASNNVPVSPTRPTNLNTGTGPCSYMYGPDFRNLYAPGTTLTGQGQSVALVEFDDFYDHDLQYYENLIQPPLSTIAAERVPVAGATTGSPGEGNTEVIGDIDMVISMAPSLDHVYVYEGPANPGDMSMAYDTAAQTVFNDIQNPSGLTTATGAAIAQANQVSSSWVGFDGSYIAKALTLMAAGGQSVFFASGDAGPNVASNPSFNCGGSACALAGPFAHDPITLQAADGSTQSIDAVNFMTLVGGTQSASGTGTNVMCMSEQTWADSFSGGYSGGGFVPNAGLPAYQNPLMFTPASAGGNNGSTTSRNFPDVAAMADAIWVRSFNGNGPGNCCQHLGTCDKKAAGPISGTSFASPLWAGFAALIHEQRANATLGPIGLLNPYLYNVIGFGPNYLADMFDVQVGSSNPSSSDPTHYEAIPGFDLATGWGSPRLGLISDLARPAPSPGIVTYDTVTFVVGTGGDDLRCTSVAYVDLLDTNANELQRVYLHSEGASSWDSGSLKSVTATLNPPLAPAQIAFVKLSLDQGGGTCQVFTSSDNWNVASMSVNLSCTSSCNNPVPLNILPVPNADPTRLEDPGGGNHTMSATFPTNSACPVACASGTRCASQSDCTVGTCVGGTGIAGSGCCTQTMNACGCNNDCPAGETCFNDGANDANGTCGDTYAGTCM
jgi:hypothetical protein